MKTEIVYDVWHCGWMIESVREEQYRSFFLPWVKKFRTVRKPIKIWRDVVDGVDPAGEVDYKTIREIALFPTKKRAEEWAKKHGFIE